MTDASPTLSTRGLALQLLLTGAVLALCVWGASRFLTWAEVADALGAVDRRALGLALAFSVLTFLLRVRRAQILLPPGLRYADLLPVVAVGFVASFVIPLRMGLVVRPWLLHQRTRTPFGVGAAGVVAERALDVLVLLGLLAFVMGYALPPEAGGLPRTWLLPARAVLTSAALGGLGLIAAFALVGPERVRGVLEARGLDHGVVGRVAGLVVGFAQGTRVVVDRPVRGVEAVVHTLGMWGSGALSGAAILAALPEVPLDASLLATFWTSVMCANAVVPTPGSLGAYEAAGTAALAVFGVPESIGAAGTLVVHLVTFVVQVGLGVLCLPTFRRPTVSVPSAGR